MSHVLQNDQRLIQNVEVISYLLENESRIICRHNGINMRNHFFLELERNCMF